MFACREPCQVIREHGFAFATAIPYRQIPEICWIAAADGTQQASLDLQGNGTMQALGSDISPITLSVQNVDQNILRVKMGANGRFEVPGSLFQNTGQGDLSRLPVATRLLVREVCQHA